MGICASKIFAKISTSLHGATQQHEQPSTHLPPLVVHAQDLPVDSDCIFESHSTTLPSPEQVRARAERDGIDTTRSFRPDPVKFPELGLIVKWGQDVTIAEGQCIWFIRKHLQQSVPVPKIFGWKQDGDETFLYLELVQGDTLSSRWTELNDSQKESICIQLRDIISSYRRIVKPPGSESLLSQIGNQPLRDIMFSDAGKYPAGPFPTVTTFHDFFASLLRRSSARTEIEELSGLADNTPVIFTHADLDQFNILISKPNGEREVQNEDVRIVALIDWHQSGWYPEPWEVLKAKSVAGPGGDWVKGYLPRVLEEPEYEYYYAWEFVSMGIL